MRRIVYISLVLLFAACNSDSTDQIESSSVSIASLRNTETNSRSVLISESITIEGTITGTSKYGEFYNMLIVEDESAAVKIMCEVEDLYRIYAFGNQVKINCSGLYMTNDYGAIVLGAEPTGDYTLDYISQSKLGVYITQSVVPDETYLPLTVTLDALTPLHTYQYVQLDDVTISNSIGITTFCQRDSLTGRTVDTYHTITDKAGHSAELSVDQYCSYADAQLPTEACTIQAIVGYYDGEYYLTITNCGYSY